MTGLDDFSRLAAADSGLCVVTTVRDDATVQASVVNAGVLDDPVSGLPVVGLIAIGGSGSSRPSAAVPRATLVVKSGWQWVAVEGATELFGPDEGATELFGPDDPIGDLDAERLRLVLRDVFRAAGGTHDDWDEYDRVMAAERRTAVFVTPERVYSNG